MESCFDEGCSRLIFSASVASSRIKHYRIGRTRLARFLAEASSHELDLPHSFWLQRRMSRSAALRV